MARMRRARSGVFAAILFSAFLIPLVLLIYSDRGNDLAISCAALLGVVGLVGGSIAAWRGATALRRDKMRGFPIEPVHHRRGRG